MALIYFTTIVTITLIWIINRWYLRAYVRLAYKVPSNKWHTLLGWGKLLSAKEILSYMNEYGKKYGPNCVFWLGPVPIFYTTDPQTLKEILTAKNCIDKPAILYRGISSLLGEGLVSVNDPFWSHHRKLMNRAFSNKNLISFIPLFQKEAKGICKEIKSNIEKGEIIDMFFTLQKLTFVNTTKTILKRDLEHTDYNAINMLNDVHEIQEIITVSCVSYSFKLNWIRKIAEVTVFKNGYKCVAKLKKIIADSVDILQNNVTTDPSYCPDVNSALECALNGVKQNVLKLDEIEGEIAQLFAAAFDTTSITIFLVIMLLAMHPQYQERAYEEIVSILPNNEDDDDHIRLEQLNQLVYLEMIFNETIRVLPVVPMVLRKVTNEDLALSNGITLPVGHILCIDIFSLHRSKELWGPKADIFNPDNFLPSNVASRDPFSFIPFTKGQRFCIGWRYATLFTKIALVNLIKTFKFTTDYKYRDLKFTSRITLQLSENPQINVERRKTGEY